MAGLALAAAGCAGKQAKKPLAAAPVQSAEAAPSDSGLAAAPSVIDQETSDRSVLQEEIPQLARINFGYDSSILSAQARKTLQGNAEWLRNNPGVRVQVAGYCDQRGTVEFNLALGQRRAGSVRDYYVNLGIAGDRISMISYGKEKLVCREMSESCWAKNRRAETLRTLPQVVSRVTP